MKLFSIFLFLFSFKLMAGGVTVTSHVPLKSTYVLLRATSLNSNHQPVVDTLFFKNGQARSRKALEPGFYQLDFPGEGKINIALESKPLDVEIRGKEKKKLSYAVPSSSASAQIKAYDRYRAEVFNRRVNVLKPQIARAVRAGDEDEIARLTSAENAATTAYRHELLQYARNNMKGLALLYASIRMDEEKDIAFWQKQAALLKKEYPLPVAQLEQKLKRYARLLPGRQAPDFTITDLEGRTVRLSDYSGRWVLLDFWAAWCLPCRQENINYARAYAKYKEDGFEIVAVSLDTSPKLLKQAIQRDKAIWKQLSDYKGWDSPAARLYNVNAIPANILIDPRGRIVKKNIRGKDLLDTLEDIF